MGCNLYYRKRGLSGRPPGERNSHVRRWLLLGFSNTNAVLLSLGEHKPLLESMSSPTPSNSVSDKLLVRRHCWRTLRSIPMPRPYLQMCPMFLPRILN